VNATPGGETPPATAEAGELHRLCVFELDLDCGHCVTVAVNGWHPVSVACCDRLGGTWLDGTYIPFSSTVDYVRVVEERYEHRPPGAERAPTRMLARRARTRRPGHPQPAMAAGRRRPVPGPRRRAPSRPAPRATGAPADRAVSSRQHRPR
jgi:hypothetical protein